MSIRVNASKERQDWDWRLRAAYMKDACWRQARQSRPALGRKDARKCDWLTEVDFLGSGAIRLPDILNGVEPQVVAAGLRMHTTCSGHRIG